jgi:hypothetical protein
MPNFGRTIGIDYSGAETPTASLKGLRVYLAEGEGHPVEVPPPQAALVAIDIAKNCHEILIEPVAAMK